MQIPNGLTAFNQFVVYKLVPNGAKTTKLPVDYRTGALPASGQGVAGIWTDAENAQYHADQLGEGYGVGFFFTETDPYWFLDIDNAYDGAQWSELAQSLISTFAGAYVEVSQSGRGLHIIGSGAVPRHACKNVAYGLELYHADRFVALTGTHAMGDVDFNTTHLMVWLVDTYFAPPTSVSAAWTDGPDPDWNGNTDDDELIND